METTSPDAILNINGDSVNSLEILVLLTLITLLPSILIMMSSFTRIIITLSFFRNAIGLQQTPPNNVLIGIALFMTLMIMSPVISEINTEAYQPYKEEIISQEQALEIAAVPLKEFMLKSTEVKSLNMFREFSNTTDVENAMDLPMTVIIPAFMTSELNHAFIMGFLLYIPFMLMDMIVSSILMSMGMIMLPPVMISMPFKIILFIVAGGWDMFFSSIIRSFS